MSEQRKVRLRRVDRSVVVPAIGLDELVDPNHPVRALWEYVNLLDMSPLEGCIRALEGTPGRNATDPRILLALWMWATSDGVGSARALETRCREHNVYRWLVGGVSVNYHLLATFRSSHQDVLNGFLEAHVSALLHEGVIELACVAQDGMRTRASAGAGSFRRAQSIEECQQLVRTQLEQLQRQDGEALDAVARRQRAARLRHTRERDERLAQAREVAAELQQKRQERARKHPKEAKERKTTTHEARASTTDPECRKMKMPDGGFRPAYNVQCSTTTDSGIIVGVSVTNQGSDGGLMGPMLDQIEEAYGRVPASCLTDGGFASTADVESAEARGVTVYAPLKNADEDLAAGKDPYAPKPGDSAAVAAWRARMGTPEAQELYKKRASTAEWVNAGMRQRNLYQVSVRGLRKVLGVVLLHALVHNLFHTIRICRTQCPNRKWTEILRAGTTQNPSDPTKGEGSR